MNQPFPPSCFIEYDTPTGLPLVGIVELKWLAAGVGLPVHIERMQHDADYAVDVLDRAAHAGMGSLARLAERLRAQLTAGG